jgi:hypothetical protein
LIPINDYIKGFELKPGATEVDVRNAVASLGVPLPADYLQFLGDHNGGEGFIGVNYLVLWSAEELVPFNRDNQLNGYAPGLILIGSDGGGETFAFDSREPSMPIVMTPAIDMSLEDAKRIAPSFTEFLNTLATPDLGDFF